MFVRAVDLFIVNIIKLDIQCIPKISGYVTDKKANIVSIFYSMVLKCQGTIYVNGLNWTVTITTTCRKHNSFYLVLSSVWIISTAVKYN